MSGESMFVESLRNRIRALNTLWSRCVEDMTLDHVNYQERDRVLPIAFSLSHYMRAQDQAVSRPFLAEAPLWETGGWAEKIGVTVDALGREESIDEMQHIRFANFDAYRDYQSRVIERTSSVLEAVDEPMLAQVLLPKLPPNMQNIFCGIVIGADAPLRKLEVLECFVYQHGLRHMGEIEHGRALVGLEGMTS
jgi:hypothetical protein